MSLHLGSTIHATLVYVGIKDGQSPPLRTRIENRIFFIYKINNLFASRLWQVTTQRRANNAHTHTHTYATIKFQMDLLKLSASLLELFDGNKVDHSCCCSCLLLPRVSTCAWIILILPGGALISMKEGRWQPETLQ
jgi:hypothetical protein